MGHHRSRGLPTIPLRQCHPCWTAKIPPVPRPLPEEALGEMAAPWKTDRYVPNWPSIIVLCRGCGPNWKTAGGYRPAVNTGILPDVSLQNRWAIFHPQHRTCSLLSLSTKLDQEGIHWPRRQTDHNMGSTSCMKPDAPGLSHHENICVNSQDPFSLADGGSGWAWATRHRCCQFVFRGSVQSGQRQRSKRGGRPRAQCGWAW